MALLLSAIKVNCVVSVCELIVDQEQERWSLVSVRAIVWTQPRKTWNKWTFLNGTHTENTMSMKHWSMIGGNHCSSTTNNIIFCSLWHFLIWSLWEHDLIIEASPICNNLPAIVILNVSFTENKLWPCAQSLGYFSLYSFISFILWNWGQIANLASSPRQRQRGPATHIIGLYCVILPEFLALLTSFDWCGESKAIYFISAAGD